MSDKGDKNKPDEVLKKMLNTPPPKKEKEKPKDKPAK